MKKLLFTFSTVLILASCGGNSTDSQLEGKVYTVVESETNEFASKVTTTLSLNHRLTEDSLELVAKEIKAQHPDYETLFIFYYLDGEKSSGMAWATTHYTPDLEVTILGSTEEEEQAAQVEKFGLSYEQRKEIFQETYKLEVDARKKADEKYPMLTVEEVQKNSEKYANYKTKLVEQAQKDVMNKYNISDSVFWEISTEGIDLDWTPEGVY